MEDGFIVVQKMNIILMTIEKISQMKNCMNLYWIKQEVNMLVNIQNSH